MIGSSQHVHTDLTIALSDVRNSGARESAHCSTIFHYSFMA